MYVGKFMKVQESSPVADQSTKYQFACIPWYPSKTHPKFSQFHVGFFLENRRLASSHGGLAPLLRGILDPPLPTM